MHCCIFLQNVDGVLLTIDPNHMEQERELEQLYLNFAQPNSLAMKQCMVLGLTVNNAASTGSWAGADYTCQAVVLGMLWWSFGGCGAVVRIEIGLMTAHWQHLHHLLGQSKAVWQLLQHRTNTATIPAAQ